MKQLSIFAKGLITDIDPLHLKNDSWTYPTSNIRIVNYEGGGLVITSKEGEFQENITLPTGYYIKTWKLYNGIIYMVLFSNTTDSIEIGTYPSPKGITITNGHYTDSSSGTGFENTYKPLCNITTNLCFNHAHWDISGCISLDMELLSWYDGSVNIYLAFDNIPAKIINSNFDTTGKILGHIYTDTSEYFNKYLNHILTTGTKLDAIVPVTASPEFIRVEAGGELKPGNYFLYFRYVTQHYDRTNIVNNTNVISVVNGYYSNGVSGVQEKNWITGQQNKTNKKIVLSIEGADTTFPYFEIVVLRYKSINENTIAIPDTYVIDYLYKTTDSLVSIYGNENEIAIDITDLYPVQNILNIVKSHIIDKDRWFGANFKALSKKTGNDLLQSYAQTFTIDFNVTDIDLYNPDMTATITGTSSHQLYYQDPNYVNKRLGYFDNEIYPFGICGKYPDGSYSPVYPIYGNITGYESTGLVQLTNSASDYEKLLYVMVENVGVQLTKFTELAVHFESLHLVRGERIKNIVYTGLAFRCTKGVIFNKDFNSVNDEVTQEFENSKIIPVIGKEDESRLGFPVAKWNMNGGQPELYDYNICSYNTYLDNKLAVFSGDLFFENAEDILISDGGQYIIQQSHYAIPNSLPANDNIIVLDDTLTSMIRPQIYAIGDANETIQIDDQTERECTVNYIPAYTYNTSSNFSSLFKDADPYLQNSEIGFRYDDGNEDFYGNRSVKYPAYLGITVTNAGSIVPITPIFIHVSIKKQTNVNYISSTCSSFKPENTQYNIIGEISASTIGNAIWNGDCFKQPINFIFQKFFDTDTNASHIANSGSYEDKMRYEYGIMMRLFGQNRKNCQFRNNVTARDAENNQYTYSYWPKISEELSPYNDAKQWIVSGVEEDDFRFEAFQLNDSYNKVLPETTLSGYDVNVPVSYVKENRIFVSNKYISGSIQNQLRHIQTLNYKDICVQDGEIMKIHKDMDGNIYSMHRYCINRLNIDEKYIQQNNNLVLAISKDIIADEYERLSTFGISHLDHVINATSGVYGVDIIQGILWALKSQYSQYRQKYATGFDLGKSKYIKSEIDNSFEILNFDPYNFANTKTGSGKQYVTLGYDPKYNEVYYTLYKDLENQVLSNHTFIFSEVIDGFISIEKNTNRVLSYLNTDIKLFYKLYLLDKLYSFSTTNSYKPMELSFYVNGNVSEQENYVALQKIFESIGIEMKDLALTTVDYSTEYQSATYTYSASGLNKKQYLNGHINLPIPYQSSATVNHLTAKAPLRGQWLKVYIKIGVLTERVKIRKVITNFKVMSL